MDGNNVILIDYSAVCVAAILAFSADLKRGSENEKKDLIRHVALSSIRSYKKKYGKEFGDIVIACDGRHYWRREVFQYYKGNRKKAREASDIDWKLIFDTLSEIRDDLVKHFPYKVIHIDRAEGDDVIAVIAESTQEFGQFEPVMIISSDNDFVQLQEHDNVKQFSPMTKKLISVNKKQLREKLITHIVKAGDDGIPNILSADDVFMTGTRQTSVSAKRLAEFIEVGIDACRNDIERARWQRNYVMTSFKCIPEDIKESIITAYAAKATGDKNSIMNYLIKNKCRQLLDSIEEF